MRSFTLSILVIAMNFHERNTIQKEYFIDITLTTMFLKPIQHQNNSARSDVWLKAAHLFKTIQNAK